MHWNLDKAYSMWVCWAGELVIVAIPTRPVTPGNRLGLENPPKVSKNFGLVILVNLDRHVLK